MFSEIERQNFLSDCAAEDKANFSKFIEEFENILMKRHGVTINDCTDEKELRVEYLSGSTAVEFVEFIANKYEFDRIDNFPFNSNTIS